MGNVGKNINTCRHLVTGPEVKKHLQNLRVQRRILLKWILNKIMGRRGHNLDLGGEKVVTHANAIMYFRIP
jgi:hypothetical protein